LKIVAGSAQHIGRRNEQQDACGFSDLDDTDFISHAGYLVVVADGMGGLKYGAEASRLALETFLHSYATKKEKARIPTSLLKALLQGNRAVSKLIAEKKTDIGSTIVSAVIHNQLLYWVSVGDSRLYLYRNNHLTRLSKDHTYAHELALAVAAGKISSKEANQDPNQHALTSYMGMKDLSLIDCNHSGFKLEEGDKIILCSDGLYGSIDSQHIMSCMRDDPQVSADKLIAMVVACQDLNQDNVTVAILGCQKDIEELTPQPWIIKKWHHLILATLVFCIFLLGISWFFLSSYQENNLPSVEPIEVMKEKV